MRYPSAVRWTSETRATPFDSGAGSTHGEGRSDRPRPSAYLPRSPNRRRATEKGRAMTDTGTRTVLRQIPNPFRRPQRREPAPGEDIREQTLVEPAEPGPPHRDAAKRDGVRRTWTTTANDVWTGSGGGAPGRVSNLAAFIGDK